MSAIATNWPELSAYVTNHHDTYPAISPLNADLRGKAVLVTGASKGCGRATAVSLAQAGCTRIAIAARSNLDGVVAAVKAAARDEDAEMQVVAVRVDVTSAESMAAAAAAVSEAFGGVLDAVVANAGYLERWVPIHEADPDEWWTSWEVNVKGVFLTARYFMPMLLRSQTKLFVAVSSVGAHMIRPHASGYQVSKFAVIRFIEFVQQEYGPQGVVAVSVHPGGVKTDLALGMPQDRLQVLIDPPELFAGTIVWLTDKRREWLGGRFISSCWDLGELESKKEDVVARDLFKFRMTG